MHSVSRYIPKTFAEIAGIVICATAFLYGLLINNINLWTDEIYSVLMAKDSLSDMGQLLITEDSKPPLYYLYLKAVLLLFPAKYEIWGAHFASCILLISAQLFVATTIRHDYGDEIALWLMLLIALMPQSLWLALEVRTYMLSALLMLMALVYGLRLTNAPTSADFCKFGATTILALYTHYYCALWLMFLYIGILIYIIKSHQWNVLRPFLLTAAVSSVLFAPWLLVPLQTGKDISSDWYVTMDFVRTSTLFFTSPSSLEMWQSQFSWLSVLSASSLTFIIICALLTGKTSPEAQKKIFRMAGGTFTATFVLLILLSVFVRPLVTARYMHIFSLIWFMAGAVVLAQNRFCRRGFLLIALLGFAAAYDNFRNASFDTGYKNVIGDIKNFIPTNKKIITFDNTNLFCEYYLPEYTCLSVVGKKGEILRKQSILKNIDYYRQKPDDITFSISIHTRRINTSDCQEYQSYYRLGQNIQLCRLNAPVAQKLLEDSLNLRLKQERR